MGVENDPTDFGAYLERTISADPELAAMVAKAEAETKNEKCFAYQERDGSIDLDSIAESVERVRDKMLASSLGWRYHYQQNHGAQWKLLLQHGKVVEVVILIVPELNAG